jgi:hypothetical protein
MSPQASTLGLSARDIAERVLALEGALDLSGAEWQEADVHWWPLYRTELYRLMFAADAGALAIGRAGRARAGTALRRSRREHPAVPAGAVWLVSDGISYAKVGKQRVERFCGPLFSLCRGEGYSAVVIDRAGPVDTASEDASRWLAPWTLRAKIVGTLRALPSLSSRHARLTECVATAAASLGLPPPGLLPRRMHAMAGAVLGLAGRLERSLREDKVRAVFIVSFYDVAGYAYTLAAARAGIPSADVQHGVTGRYHLAYARWPTSRLPWRLLPRWFWTWTAEDAAVIEQWASPGAHRAVWGGNPFLDAWREGTLDIDSNMRLQLKKLEAAAGTRTPVLVTLQPGLTHAKALAPLLEAMASCKTAFWWLRLHPMSLNSKPELEALLNLHGIEGFEIDSSTALPLPALLSKCALHATHSSSVFIEASAMGKPSIIWSQYGAELAESALAKGSARLALDGPSLAALVESGITTEESMGAAPRGRAALHTILESPWS